MNKLNKASWVKLPGFFAVLLLAGCQSQPPTANEGTAVSPSTPQMEPHAPAPETVLGGLPTIDALPPAHSSTGATYVGNLLDDGPVQMSASGALYDGATLELSPEAGQLAWAIFAVQGYPEDGSTLPAYLRENSTGAGWLGLGDFSQGHWDLLPLPVPELPAGFVQLPLPGGSQLLSNIGTFYLAVIAHGTSLSLSDLTLTSEDPLPLEAPEMLSASSWEREDGIEITWRAVAKAEGYDIFRDDMETPLAQVGNTSRFLDLAVTDFDGHEYRVRARNAAGESGLSNGKVGAKMPPLPAQRFSGWNRESGDSSNSNSINVPGPLPVCDELASYGGPFPGGIDGDSIVTDHEGAVFLGMGDKLSAFAADGSPRWEYVISGVCFELALGPGNLILASVYSPKYLSNYGVLALDQKTGSVAWEYESFGLVMSLYSHNVGVYLIQENGLVVNLNLAGEEEWILAHPGGVYFLAVAPSGVLYGVTRASEPEYTSLSAWSPQHEKLWEAVLPDHQVVRAPVVTRSGYILATFRSMSTATDLFDAVLACFNEQGDLVWTYEGGQSDPLDVLEAVDGSIRFIAAENTGGGGPGIPAGKLPSALVDPTVYCLTPSGACNWVSPINSSLSKTFLDAKGSMYMLTGWSIQVLDANGVMSNLLDIQGNELGATSLLIPAGPYRLLTGIPAGVMLEDTRLIAVGQGN